jgi:protease-4
MPSRPGFLRRFFGTLWSLLDFTRRFVLNVLFLLLLVFLWFAWVGTERAELRDNTALVLALRGNLVEQYTGGSYQSALADALGDGPRETRLRDVLTAVDAAAKDERITRLVLVLDELDGGGIPSLREIGAAIERFKASGKPVVAWGTNYDQRRYFLASFADEVYLHPEGSLLLRGLGGYAAYYKEALDKLGVSFVSIQAGKFKNLGEPLTRTGPSPEALEAEQSWLNDVWASWTADIEKRRKLPERSVPRLIDELPQRLASSGGSLAQLALREKLIDGLKTRDEFRALQIERGATREERGGSFRQVAFSAYAAHVKEPSKSDAIGVIIAQGEILDGDAPPGLVGGRTTAELVRRARESKDIKAVVLRVDSPGGTLLGSELIRHELDLTRKAGKPVVVSMGDVAASGGYWISSASDEILADPMTITGSIGVVLVLPNFEKTLDKLGINMAGTTTTWLAGALDPRRPLDPRLKQILEAGVNDGYRRFITRVAQSRKTEVEKIDAVGQGRVWSGRQAKERGLIDTLGGFRAALDSAARRAKLGDDYRVAYLEREPRGIDRYLSLLFGQFARVMVAELGFDFSTLLRSWRQDIAGELRLFSGAHDDPLRAYAYCFCRLR